MVPFNPSTSAKYFKWSTTPTGPGAPSRVSQGPKSHILIPSAVTLGVCVKRCLANPAELSLVTLSIMMLPSTVNIGTAICHLEGMVHQSLNNLTSKNNL